MDGIDLKEEIGIGALGKKYSYFELPQNKGFIAVKPTEELFIIFFETEEDMKNAFEEIGE